MREDDTVEALVVVVVALEALRLVVAVVVRAGAPSLEHHQYWT